MSFITPENAELITYMLIAIPLAILAGGTYWLFHAIKRLNKKSAEIFASASTEFDERIRILRSTGAPKPNYEEAANIAILTEYVKENLISKRMRDEVNKLEAENKISATEKKQS
jgi:hypothetical protein